MGVGDARLPMVYTLPKIQGGQRNNRIYASYAGKGSSNEPNGHETGHSLRNTI